MNLVNVSHTHLIKLPFKLQYLSYPLFYVVFFLIPNCGYSVCDIYTCMYVYMFLFFFLIFKQCSHL